MRRFFNAQPEAFDEVRLGAMQGNCVCFRNVELPPTCEPYYTDIGFEVDANESVVLLVNLGVVYSGSNREIARWFTTGKVRFDGFQSFVRWLQTNLAPEYEVDRSHVNLSTPVSPDLLTDVRRVKDQIRNGIENDRVDEEQLKIELKKYVRGQDSAVERLASCVATHCAKISPKRPASAFLLGPSGVGKTRSVESLAQILARKRNYHYLRLDMSEFQEPHRVSSLLGAPQGYVGYGTGAPLLNTLRSNPRTLVLFDEIEKAHPDILKALMNALDAGRLSSSSFGETDCRQAIFVFTSNLNSDEVIEAAKAQNAFGVPSLENEICRKALLARQFKSEIVGRIGTFLIYRPLDADSRVEIATLSLVEFAEEFGLNVARVSPELVSEILQTDVSASLGSRPTRGIVEEKLGTLFALEASKYEAQPIEVLTNPVRIRPVDKHDDEAFLAKTGRADARSDS